MQETEAFYAPAGNSHGGLEIVRVIHGDHQRVPKDGSLWEEIWSKMEHFGRSKTELLEENMSPLVRILKNYLTLRQGRRAVSVWGLSIYFSANVVIHH